MQNMLFGLNLGLDSSDGNPGDNIPYRQAPYQHLHHPHQHPDHYRSGSIQSDSNCPNQQLPMDQRLFELPSSISYNEFQLPLNLFGTTSQSISSYLSPNPSSYSSNSSKHSSFNSQYHPLSSIRDPPSQNPSPSPLARAYLSNPFDLIDPLNPSLKNSLFSCPPRESRESRSGSVVSLESSTNWHIPRSFSSSAGPFNLPRWEDDEPNWGIPNFGEDSGHERSKSEGDLAEQRTPSIHTSNSDCLEISFDLTGARKYLDRSDFHLGDRAHQAWSAENESLIGSTDDSSSFDPTRSDFVLQSLPSPGSNGSVDQALSSADQHEGPILASFALPPPDQLVEDQSNPKQLIFYHPKRPRTHSGLGLDASSFLAHPTTIVSHPTPSMIPTTLTNSHVVKVKKLVDRTPRTGNNGGRSRRLAPANRECKHCGAKFTRNDRLNYHIDSIHERKEPKFKCTESNCQKAFRQKSDLVRHLKHVHRHHPRDPAKIVTLGSQSR